MKSSICVDKPFWVGYIQILNVKDIRFAARSLVPGKKEGAMAKIFVRHRRHIGEGARHPRFAIVAVEGADLTVYRSRIRRVELETIAAEIGAEVVYLPQGEHADEEGGGRRGRRRRQRDED
jgi:hypothetical protein